MLAGRHLAQKWLHCRPHLLLLFGKASFDSLAHCPIVSNSLSSELHVLLSERGGGRASPVNIECRQTYVLVKILTAPDTIGIAPEDVVEERGFSEPLDFNDSPQGLRAGDTCYGVVYRADRRLSIRAEKLIALMG